MIAAFVLLVFVDFGGAGPGGAMATDAALTVNGDKITVRDFESAYRRTESIYRSIYREQYTPELAREIGLAQQVLNGLVDSRLLAAEADRMGVAVTDQEVQDAILEEPSLQDDDGNFIGAEEYVERLRRAGLTAETFEGQIRDDLLTAKMRGLLAESVYVSDGEVEEAYRLTAEKAKVRFVRLPIAQFSGEVEVAAAEVEAYFSEHSEDFRQPERRSVEYLKVDTQALRDALEIEETDLRAYYQENLAEIHHR